MKRRIPFFGDAYHGALKTVGVAAVLWFIVWDSIFLYGAWHGIWAYMQDPRFWGPITFVELSLMGIVAFWKRHIDMAHRGHE